MNNQIFSIAYFSKSSIKGSINDVAREIESILTLARSNNKEQGITGALLYSGGYFSQVIEGPMDAVEDLFETIQNDPRHTDVSVLHFNPIPNRSFSDWSMALAGIEDTLFASIDAILKSPDELESEQAGTALINVLYDLVKRHEGQV
ncbi:BLUF domain-containing protein [Leptothoe kymatousa]|uniref:BLUF domain-containing protein n=1 Tax=Leptothoe kymatousa TAU-MAC 1615 TaxID=2364775 RepID=A0ABS5Y512_9CYAN|nr:BLUF domain-containing protein [Leptothoe kymatousa]MBT9312923.1 BLUF domain-containing protein [Leptothoe kymatousa TAU-MAC 1615]